MTFTDSKFHQKPFFHPLPSTKKPQPACSTVSQLQPYSEESEPPENRGIFSLEPLKILLGTVIDLVPLPAVLISLEQGQLLLQNSQARDVLQGANPEPFESTTLEGVVADSDYSQLLAALRSGVCLKDQILQMQYPGQPVCPVRLSAQLIDCTEGPVALLIWQDLPASTVPPQTNTQQHLEAEWQKFAALVANSNDFIAMSSTDGEILYINEAGRRLVGLDLLTTEFPRSIAAYLPQDDLVHFCEVTLPTLQSTGRHEGEGRLRHLQTGEYFDMHRSCFTVRHPETQAVLCLATVQRNITAQKQAERALQQSEERFRAIAEALPIPMLISRVQDGTILYANPQVGLTFGLPQECLSGLSTLDFYDNLADRESLLQQLSSDGYISSAEIQVKKADGSPFWVAVSLQYLTFDNEVALLSTFYDITARRQAEELIATQALQQAAIANLGQQALAGLELTALMHEAVTLLAQVLQVNLTGMFELLPDGRSLQLQAGVGWHEGYIGVARVSSTENSLMGHPRSTLQPIAIENIQTDPWFQTLSLWQEHQVVSSLSVVIPGPEHPFGILAAYTTHPQNFTQDERYFLQSIANVLATAIERKQIEARLRLMERAISASSNGIVITDANQRDNPIIYANPMFEIMTGYRVSEVMGHNCRFLQGTDKNQPALATLRTALANQHECHVVLRNYRQDGSLFWNELHLAPVFDSDGGLTHFIGIQTDITQRKQAEEALRASEERLEDILGSLEDVVWSASVDGFQLLYLSAAVEKIYGRSVTEFFQDAELWLKAVHPEDRDRVAQISSNILTSGGKDLEYRILRPNREVRWLHDRCKVIYDATGQAVRVDGIASDITVRKQAEEALRKSEEQFRLIFELAPIGMALNTLDGHFLRVNQAFCNAIGYDAEALQELTFASITHPEDLPTDMTLTQKLIQGELPHFQIEKRYLDRNGRVMNALLQATLVRDAAGNPLHTLAQVMDISDRKRMEQQLLHDAFHDALTGLPNRLLFMERLQQVMQRYQHSSHEQFAVLFLDLDRFKVVNDSLGHLAGDQLLMAIAQRLKSCLRPHDLVARLGGDEFTVLLDSIQGMQDAVTTAERIQQVLRAPFNLNNHEVFTTASIGIALNSNGYEHPEDLLRSADTAMYRAKEQGKSCYAVFNADMHAQAVALLQLETDVRWAIERQELRVFYQPIIALETGRITGFEALLRWYHPERGLILPDTFITVAEETGLILPLGQWVLWEACRQLRQWQLLFPACSHLSINVNLSSKQFSQSNLTQQIIQTLHETNLAPHHLKLEITESGIMENAACATSLLQQLKALNVQICIDDFGTGYSSLHRLHQFPIDMLKIDRSFISSIGQETENTEIVKAITMLASSLGMQVVAEGVETDAQLAHLKHLQCQYAQGYLFSKPLNSNAARALLMQHFAAPSS